MDPWRIACADGKHRWIIQRTNRPRGSFEDRVLVIAVESPHQFSSLDAAIDAVREMEKAASSDWSEFQPSYYTSLAERVEKLKKDFKRVCAELDRSIVRLVEPWQERIEKLEHRNAQDDEMLGGDHARNMARERQAEEDELPPHERRP